MLDEDERALVHQVANLLTVIQTQAAVTRASRGPEAGDDACLNAIRIIERAAQDTGLLIERVRARARARDRGRS